MRTSRALLSICAALATAGALAAEPAAREELVVTAPPPRPLELAETIAADKVEITVDSKALKIEPPSVKPPVVKAAPAADKEPLASSARAGNRG